MGNFVVSWIGSKIKSLRNQKSLSLKQLSDQSKVSKSLLSKIENSRTIPSLPVFINILEALQIAPKDFFDDLYLQDGKNFTIIREEDRQDILKENRIGFSYKSIFSQNLSGFNIDIVQLSVSPHARYEPTMTDGYEFKLVLAGEIDYMVGQELAHLCKGDAIFFDGRMPHYPIARDEQVEILVIYFLFGG